MIIKKLSWQKLLNLSMKSIALCSHYVINDSAFEFKTLKKNFNIHFLYDMDKFGISKNSVIAYTTKIHLYFFILR